ncbi:MAG: hypothetical protein QME68_02140, partial [Elusimicrobiota bacterium]|nr:hypothetical protein [Elusimicrobiota bacterium]
GEALLIAEFKEIVAGKASLKAEICENCYEKYYPSGVIGKLIDIKEKLKRDRLKLHSIGRVYETV